MHEINKFCKIVLVFIFASLVIGLAIFNLDLANAETYTMYAVCANGNVNVRAEPSYRARIEGHVEFGWDVEVIDEKKVNGVTWYKVNGITELGYGWIVETCLIDFEPEKVDISATVNANGRVAVYKKINGARKTWAKNKSEVHIKIYSDQWCLTDKGWIKTEYLNISK